MPVSSAMSRYSGSACVNGARAIVVKSFFTDGGMWSWYLFATSTVVCAVSVRAW
jgi:hypothetical protein